MFEGLFQPMHLLVILGVGLLFFGPKKLPELGKGLGEGIRKFKTGLKEDTRETVLVESQAGEESSRNLSSAVALHR
jgi:sec-independent protein translocase protein TatA